MSDQHVNDQHALVSSAPSNHRSSSDDGTASRGKAVSSRNSTPDMTHTNNDEQPKLSGTTNNPFVPDGALAASPLHDQHFTAGGGGLPHPFPEDEYSTFGGVQEYHSNALQHGETSPPGGRGGGDQVYDSNSDAPTALVSDASYNGNPFVASSDDERTKQKHVRRVKASSPPTASHRGNGTRSTSPSSGARQVATTTSSVQQFNDFEDDPFGIGGPAAAHHLVDDGTINGGGVTMAGADPFAQAEEATLEKTNTALQDDPFTDEGYYRTLAAETVVTSTSNATKQHNNNNKPTPEPADDPFAHFGEAPFDAGAGRGHHDANAVGRQSAGGSILQTNGSILRRQSQYGPQSKQQQDNNHLGVAAKPRRQSVAVALSQSKPKQKAEEFAGPIDVVSTIAVDAERKASTRPQDADYSAEEVASVDKAAEQLFMPSMKREQYIPVRVAREKIKLILSEMAQMKLLHLSAIDTMEKQHQFLKAQLETACAAYCRKLTSDYNNRVVALNMEYKKRLAGVGSGARGGAVVSPAPSATPIPALAPSLSPNSEDGRRVQLLEEQLAAKQRELDVANQTTHECLERADEADDKLKTSREEIRRLKLEVERLQEQPSQQSLHNSREPTKSPPPPGVSSSSDAELQQKVWNLENELREVRLELDNTISITEAEALKEENSHLRKQVADLQSQLEFQRHSSSAGTGGSRRNLVATESAYNFS